MRIITIFILVLACLPALAHQDRIIKITEDGELIGFPDKYQPAVLDTDKRIIIIGESTYTFPECMSDFFLRSKTKELVLYSSWYHHNKALAPNYLAIGYDSDGLGFHLDLDEVKPFFYEKISAESERNHSYFYPSKDEICSAYEART